MNAISEAAYLRSAPTAEEQARALQLAIHSVAPGDWNRWLAETLAIDDIHHALKIWALHFGMVPMTMEELELIVADFELAPYGECQRRGCFIGRASKDGAPDVVYLVTHQASQLDAQQWFESRLERLAPPALLRVLVTAEDFGQYLAQAEQSLRAMDSLQAAAPDAGPGDAGTLLSLSMEGIESTTNATVRLVDSTLYDALKLGASDVHFELQHKALHIKYRLDGVLQLVKQVDGLEVAHQVVSRIKVLADLDISEHRIPQDGRFRALMAGREIDFRVSVMPNITGEDAVLRILDRRHLTGEFHSLTLDALSFDDKVKAFIRRAATLPYGLLLVTGPTGSGKTTTLYAALTEINTGLDKIITIEDPIEYQLSGVLQIPVNEKKGLTFAKGLRSVLRHDPDKIMVGEIRDSETAHIAVQAALTGHQVFTTVHANNVFDVISRFSNMGVDNYSLVAALTGIMAQRLVRGLCQACSADVPFISPESQAELPEGRFKRAVGCQQCRGTGYKGRLAIAETLQLDDDMKDLLVKQAAISELKRAARGKGFRDLRESALALAARGLTSLEEINRVTPA